MDRKRLDRIHRFVSEATKVKEVKRTGWVIAGIKNPEHVGDHIFSTALLAYLMAKERGLDADKCMKMALLHDVHEAITGDIARRYREEDQEVDRETKKRLEIRDNARILSYLGSLDRKDLERLIEEAFSGKSKEAKLVREADALDWLIQLEKYSDKIKSDKRANEFFLTADVILSSREGRYLYDKIRKKVYKERKMK